MRPISEIRRESMGPVIQSYGWCLLTYVCYLIIQKVANRFWVTPYAIFNFCKDIVLELVVISVLSVGLSLFYIKLMRRENATVGEFFRPFGHYGHHLAGMLWRYLWIAIWSLLIVPAIIKWYESIFVPYILADCPNVKARKALRMSKALTNGHKWEIFLLQLSIIWPCLVGVLAALICYWYGLTTISISILLAVALFVALLFFHFYHAAMAQMYLELRDEALQRQILAVEDFQ